MIQNTTTCGGEWAHLPQGLSLDEAMTKPELLQHYVCQFRDTCFRYLVRRTLRMSAKFPYPPLSMQQDKTQCAQYVRFGQTPLKLPTLPLPPMPERGDEFL